MNILLTCILITITLVNYDVNGFEYCGCPNGWTYYVGSCYHFADDFTGGWRESTTYCSTLNANLVQIENAGEDDFVKSQCRKMFRPSDPQTYLLENSFWTGGTDDITEGQWKWYQDKLLMQYTAWPPGQPDLYHGANKDCLYLYSRNNFTWHDSDCHARYHPICELRLTALFASQSPAVG